MTQVHDDLEDPVRRPKAGHDHGRYFDDDPADHGIGDADFEYVTAP